MPPIIDHGTNGDPKRAHEYHVNIPPHALLLTMMVLSGLMLMMLGWMAMRMKCLERASMIKHDLTFVNYPSPRGISDQQNTKRKQQRMISKQWKERLRGRLVFRREVINCNNI
jgi:hypothetical protein